MSKTPRISVIVPTYNRRMLLERTLDALVRQTLAREDFEVLVIDDGSSDDSEAAALKFADRLNLSYFFQPDEGYRVALARNTGLRNARAPLSALFDAGVLPKSDCLRAHLDAHARGAPRAVIGYVYCFNEDNEDAAEIRRRIDLDDLDGTIAEFDAAGLHLDIREEFYAKYGDDFNHLPAPWLVFWTCHVSVPTASAHAVGLFDEAFRIWGGEDVEFAHRLHRAGLPFHLARDAAAIHYPHPKSCESNQGQAALNYRYFHEKFPSRTTELIKDRVHFFLINDLLLGEAEAGCASASPAIRLAR